MGVGRKRERERGRKGTVGSERGGEMVLVDSRGKLVKSQTLEGGGCTGNELSILQLNLTSWLTIKCSSIQIP